ncbi:MarR family transcriptional regulator [Paramagnetospirillum caucaseum]|uniref:MarR family transcriptional regulator n=1 Tax=Paramagnetospirillum caucaseum TaxID=1244869 RepID=M2ZMH9_9PROT|nr:MarR family transcriptional regulator [Paramagnetospirillum caucaseum]EME68497.1 MarR family transcriptional regulator [Paramagnetospirillum caucaseum]
MFDLNRFLPYHLNRTGVRLAAAFSKELERFNLTLPMWRVLAVLWHHGELKVSDIIVDTTIEQSTLSRLLVTMEERDLITRERSKLDARTVVVNLTPSGRKVTKTLIPWALKFERTAFKDFSQEEIDTLYAMLTRIFENSAELLP